MGIASLFDSATVIISEEIGYEKPAEEIYQKALSVFGISAENAIFVGDSWVNDVVGPGNIGISSIWFNKKREEVTNHPKLIGANSLSLVRSGMRDTERGRLFSLML